MKTQTRVQKALFLLLALTVALPGFSKVPDLSGTWVLNKAKSKLNAEYSRAPVRITLTQEANSMTMERVSVRQGSEVTRTSKYTLDGKESVNEGFQGSQSVSIAQWADDDKSLSIITTQPGRDGGEMKIYSSYRMDGKALVVENRTEGGQRESAPETWVFDKQ
jgi:hypothetical protein